MSTPTIVSLTPLDVQADSRTYKEAASFRRFGYRSIVVEGYRSSLDPEELPFELVSSGPVRPRPVIPAPKSWGTPRTDVSSVRLALRESRRFVRKVRRAALRLSLAAMSAAVPPAAKEALNAGSTYLHSQKAFRRYLSHYLKVHVLRTLRHAPRASVYYLHAFYQFPAVWALCRMHNARYVYDAHDFYSSFPSHGFTKDPVLERWVGQFELAIEAACVRGAAEVVTVSEGVAELIERAFGRRPAVILNAQDSRLSRPPRATLRGTLGLGADDFLLVVVGNAKEGMAVLPMMEAMLGCPPHVHLAFVGAGYDRFLDAVTARRLTERVHLLPPVKPFEVVPFIESADAAAVPYFALHSSIERCLPNGFFSAISAGLPCLYPPLPDLVRADPQQELGLQVDPCSPEAVRAAILRLVREPQLLEGLRAKVRARRPSMDWAEQEPALRRVLEAALGEAARNS